MKSEINVLVFRTISTIHQQLLRNKQKLFFDNASDDQSFQILGFDVLIDIDMKPWLLEVNQSPSFATDSPFDQQLKFNLVKDTFQLMGVQNNLRHSKPMPTQRLFKPSLRKQLNDAQVLEIVQQRDFYIS